MKSRSTWLVCLSLVLAAYRANAQAESPPEPPASEPAADSPADDLKSQAQQQYQLGAEAYEAGRFKDAIDHFLKANRLVPSAALSFNMARSYEKLGDWAGALASYRDYLRRAPDAEDREQIEQAISGLEQRLRAKGVQQVTVLSEPHRATVVLDGEPVGVTPWTGELVPGEHRVLLRMPGYQNIEQRFVLEPGRAIDVRVPLTREVRETPAPEPAAPEPTAPAPEPTPSPVPPPPQLDSDPAPTLSPWTWLSLGVAAAALAGAVGFELARRSAEADAHSAETQIHASEQYDTMTSRQTAARVLAGVGAAGTALGGVLLYLDLSSSASGQSTARLQIGCTAKRCAVLGRGEF